MRVREDGESKSEQGESKREGSREREGLLGLLTSGQVSQVRSSQIELDWIGEGVKVRDMVRERVEVRDKVRERVGSRSKTRSGRGSRSDMWSGRGSRLGRA